MIGQPGIVLKLPIDGIFFSPNLLTPALSPFPIYGKGERGLGQNAVES
jgi:hypothetical protein